jgi:hypothetical protein
MAHPGIPDRLTPVQAAFVLGLTPATLKRYRSEGKAPEPVIVGGGSQRSRVEYTWNALNAWLRAHGRQPVTPHCPCCGRS